MQMHDPFIKDNLYHTNGFRIPLSICTHVELPSASQGSLNGSAIFETGSSSCRQFQGVWPLWTGTVLVGAGVLQFYVIDPRGPPSACTIVVIWLISRDGKTVRVDFVQEVSFSDRREQSSKRATRGNIPGSLA
jgi:hypothetical protein